MVAHPAVNPYQVIITPSNPIQGLVASNTAPDAGRKFSDMLNASADRASSNDRTQQPRAREVSSTPVRTQSQQPQRKQADTNNQQEAAPVLLAPNDEITPADAADMLQKFDQIALQLSESGVDTEAQLQFKAQLQQIVDSGEPETVADILDGVTLALNLPPVDLETKPEIVVAKPVVTVKPEVTTDVDVPVEVALPLPVQAEVITPEAPAPQTPQIGNLIHAAIHKVKPTVKKDETVEAAPVQQPAPTAIAANVLSPALLALQGGFTETTNTAPEPALPEPAIDAGAQTVTVVTPLAAELALVASNETQPIVTTNAAIDQITETPQAPTIDTLIPALTVTKKKEPTTLPEVTLPKASVDANAPATPKAPTVQMPADSQAPAPQAPAATPSPAFNQYLQNSGITGEIVKATKEPETIAVKSSDGVDAINVTPGLAGQGTITTQAVAPTATVTNHLAINHAPVAEQVSVAITRASHDGIDNITIQLSPDDMGRVEVKMRMSQDGHAQIQFTVDKPETFDSLSRDARALERSLQESGIKADTGSMQFNLRQQPQPQSDNSGGNGSQRHSANEAVNDNVVATTNAAAVTKNYTVNIRDGIDIHA